MSFVCYITGFDSVTLISLSFKGKWPNVGNNFPLDVHTPWDCSSSPYMSPPAFFPPKIYFAVCKE